MKKRALVLAGGGARGSFQVGMLQNLICERGLDFQIIRGVSVGAINAAFLAQAPTKGNSLAALQEKVEELRKLWLDEIEGNHSIYTGIGGLPGLAAVAAGADSLYSLQPLKKLIEKHLSLEALQHSGRNFAIGTVSLVSGYYAEWTPKDDYFFDKFLASASIPVVFPYIDLKSSRDILVDGGVRNITPLSSAFNARPDEIYILLTSRLIRKGLDLPLSGLQEQDYQKWQDNWLGTKVSGFDVLKRSVDILTDEIYLDDIRGALHWNEVVEGIKSVEKASKKHRLPQRVAQEIPKLVKRVKRVKKRFVKIFVLAPREWYGEKNDSTEFSPTMIEWAVDHGREIAADETLWLWPPLQQKKGIGS